MGQPSTGSTITQGYVNDQYSQDQRDQSLLLLNVTAQINFEASRPVAAVRQILNAVISLLDIQACEFWVVDITTARMHLVAHEGLSTYEFNARTTLDLGEDLPGRAAATLEVFISHDLQSDPRCVREGIKSRGFQFYAAIPIQSRRQAAAVLCVATHKPEPWVQGQFRLLETVGKILGRDTIERLLNESRTKRLESG